MNSVISTSSLTLTAMFVLTRVCGVIRVTGNTAVVGVPPPVISNAKASTLMVTLSS